MILRIGKKTFLGSLFELSHFSWRGGHESGRVSPEHCSVGVQKKSRAITISRVLFDSQLSTFPELTSALKKILQNGPPNFGHLIFIFIHFKGSKCLAWFQGGDFLTGDFLTKCSFSSIGRSSFGPLTSRRCR